MSEELPGEKFSVDKGFLKDLKSDPREDKAGYMGHPIKGIGDVYTPSEVVNFILNGVGFYQEDIDKSWRIADLSCGTGSFLREVASRIRKQTISEGYEPRKREGAREIVSRVEDSVFGFDRNTLAVYRTVQAICWELREELEQLKDREPVAKFHIYSGNSLLPKNSFSEVGFDFVVGNPPYIRNDDILDEDDEKYREAYRTADGKYDLYPLFFEKANEVVKENGKIGLVTPNRFLHTNYGKELRELITENFKILTLIRLKDDPFPVVQAYPLISILEKQQDIGLQYQNKNNFTYCDLSTDDLIEVTVDALAESQYCTSHLQSELEPGGWNFLPPYIQNLVDRVGDSEFTIKLGEMPLELKAGVATGADDVFIIDETEAEYVEEEVTIPLIRGRDIQKGDIDWGGKYLICPYREGRVINLENYPEMEAYLSNHKRKLKDRYCVRDAGKKWFETHDTFNPVKESSKRIVTPDVTSTSRFSITEGYISHNTAYSIFFDGDLVTLNSYLNSSIFEFVLKANLPEMESGHWRQLKRDMLELPVLDPSKLDLSKQQEIQNLYNADNWDGLDEVWIDMFDLSREDEETYRSYLNQD